jgi:hypothetical protein
MEVERDLEFFGTLQNRPKQLIVQVAALDVAVNQSSLETVFTDRALQLVATRLVELWMGQFIQNSRVGVFERITPRQQHGPAKIILDVIKIRLYRDVSTTNTHLREGHHPCRRGDFGAPQTGHP